MSEQASGLVPNISTRPNCEYRQASLCRSTSRGPTTRSAFPSTLVSSARSPCRGRCQAKITLPLGKHAHRDAPVRHCRRELALLFHRQNSLRQLKSQLAQRRRVRDAVAFRIAAKSRFRACVHGSNRSLIPLGRSPVLLTPRSAERITITWIAFCDT